MSIAEPKRRSGVAAAMWRYRRPFPSFAFLALLACAKPDPVDDNAVAPPDELVGDASATGLAAPANAAAAEAAQQAALPAATGGLRWTYRRPIAPPLFGPAGTPAFSIQCQKQREGETSCSSSATCRRPPAATRTLSFTGNGQAASVPIAAVSNPNGLGGHGAPRFGPATMRATSAEAFAGPGPVNVSISGAAAAGRPRHGASRAGCSPNALSGYGLVLRSRSRTPDLRRSLLALILADRRRSGDVEADVGRGSPR